jgi:hypothetical protein
MANEFRTGDLVWVDKKKHQSHFKGDCFALVLEKNVDDYSLMLHGTDFHAWYPAECLELIQEGNFQLLQQKEKELKAANEKPYIYINHVVVSTEQRYNPEYGNNRICQCGHEYYRHFDTYDNMAAIGCKYCQCRTFVEA